jgi:hypothetical protein
LVDLNPLYFYLFRYLKTLPYSAPIEKEETLQQHIFDACKPFVTAPGRLKKVQQSVIRPIHVCVDCGVGHAEYLL